jgi:uncharacterized protein with HEPN domain
MKLEAKKLLLDVIQACRDVERFTARKAFNDYLEDGMLRAAVEPSSRSSAKLFSYGKPT